MMTLSKQTKQLLFFFLSLLAFIFVISTFSYQIEESQRFNGPKVYLMDSDNNLKAVSLYLDSIIDMNEPFDIVNYVIRMLRTGSVSAGLQPTFTSDVSIINFAYEYGHVILSFDEAYYDMNPIESLMLRTSLIRSLTSFSVIDSVELLVEGLPMEASQGYQYGRMAEEDVFFSYSESSSEERVMTISLYSPTSDGRELTQTNVNIHLTTNEKEEETIINYILNYNENLIFNEDVELLNVYTHDNICFVDMNRSFLSSDLANSITDSVAIYSLVNTLTDLPQVTQVQFLVEGEIVETFKGSFSIDRRLRKNYAILGSD